MKQNSFSAGKSRVEPLATRPCGASSLPKSTLPHQSNQYQHSRPTNTATCTSHGATPITDSGFMPASSQSYHHAAPVDSLRKLSPSPLARQAQVNRRKASEERQNEHANISQPFRLSVSVRFSARSHLTALRHSRARIVAAKLRCRLWTQCSP